MYPSHQIRKLLMNQNVYLKVKHNNEFDVQLIAFSNQPLNLYPLVLGGHWFCRSPPCDLTAFSEFTSVST